MLSRRDFLRSIPTTGAALSLQGFMPGWARAHSGLDTVGLPTLDGRNFDLEVGASQVIIDGRSGRAVTINGTLPAPLLRWREGDIVTLRVTNSLTVDTSIHWHGILLPEAMDGVPGVSFPGIAPGETFRYQFEVKQAGTYWYHSHSGLQEQLGHYGPLIIDPRGDDPVAYDREYVVVLSDYTFESPHRVFAKLKKMSDAYNFQKRTLKDLARDASRSGVGNALRERAMWGAMRMSPTDIADVTSATYTYLVNGHGPDDNWTALFSPGERVRLRFVNASAMTLFNVRIPGLAMTVVQSDGLNVKPVEVDELQIGVAETYDVVVQPEHDRAYTLMGESIDRSGFARATLAPRKGMVAEVPELRPRPLLTMKDMGMAGHDGHEPVDVDHATMDHTAPASAESPMAPMADSMPARPDLEGPGVANTAMQPTSRLDEPGVGLGDVGHRVLRYTDLESLETNPDQRDPEREIELHLTGNMERYMWSFDGKKFSEGAEPIVFFEGERIRLTMINDTMMPHPIHLHGMFFDVVNGRGSKKPRKHTIVVKPAEKLSVDVTADAVGDWAFHCHLLYHMHAGMFRVVSVRPPMSEHHHR